MPRSNSRSSPRHANLFSNFEAVSSANNVNNNNNNDAPVAGSSQNGGGSSGGGGGIAGAKKRDLNPRAGAGNARAKVMTPPPLLMPIGEQQVLPSNTPGDHDPDDEGSAYALDSSMRAGTDVSGRETVGGGGDSVATSLGVTHPHRPSAQSVTAAINRLDPEVREMLQKGIHVIKYGKNGNRQRRILYLDEEGSGSATGTGLSNSITGKRRSSSTTSNRSNSDPAAAANTTTSTAVRPPRICWRPESTSYGLMRRLVAHNKPNYIDIADLERFNNGTNSPRLRKAISRRRLTPVQTSTLGRGESGESDETAGEADDTTTDTSSRYMAFSLSSSQKCLELELVKDPSWTPDESLEMYEKVTHALESLIISPSG